jgi:hypothetical protein
MLLAAGCQQSNESLFEEQERKTAGQEVKDVPPPPKTQEEFGKRSQANNPFAKGSGSGYPGTGAAKK